MHTLYGVCEKLSQGCSVILKQISFKYRVDCDAEAGGKVLQRTRRRMRYAFTANEQHPGENDHAGCRNGRLS